MRRGNNRWLGWNTNYKYPSIGTHFRWKIKWRLDLLGVQGIRGETALLSVNYSPHQRLVWTKRWTHWSCGRADHRSKLLVEVSRWFGILNTKKGEHGWISICYLGHDDEPGRVTWRSLIIRNHRRVSYDKKSLHVNMSTSWTATKRARARVRMWVSVSER